MSGKFKNMFAAVAKNNNKSNVIVDNTPYPNKPLENTKFDIPCNIFQTWQTKILPPSMFKTISKIKNEHKGLFLFLLFRNYLSFVTISCLLFIR